MRPLRSAKNFMSLNPLKLIEKLIEEHGSATIQSKNLTLLRDQITILQDQFSVLTNKHETLQSKYEHVKKQLDSYQEKEKGEQCPFCKKQTGILKTLEPHPASLMKQMGAKIGKYKCN